MKHSYNVKRVSVFDTLVGMERWSDKHEDKCRLHRPISRLSCFQKSIKEFIISPFRLTTLMNGKAEFKVAFIWYKNTQSFHSVGSFCCLKMELTFDYSV